MKFKRILASLMAAATVLSFAACSGTGTNNTESTGGTDGTSTSDITSVIEQVLATEAVKKDDPILLPLEEVANAISIEAKPVTSTLEIPLLIILANFDADGDGENDWDEANPTKLYSDKTQKYYGEQWAGSDISEHYELYFGGEYSLTNFYEEMTMGAFKYVPIPFDVVPEGSPYTDGIIEVTVSMPHPSASGLAGESITAVFEATDPYIDYSKYDTNKNGVIDATELGVVILNPGMDDAYGSNTMGGRQQFQVRGTSQNLNAKMDGVTFSKVSNLGEYGKGATDVMQIGTAAHELAHNLGAEDLYDTNRNGHGGQTIKGWPRAYNFSLESSGNHVSNGKMPTYLDPYHRIFLGWAEEVVVEDGVYTIHSTVSDKYTVLRVNTPDPGEYYLIEVRLKESFETNLTSGDSKGGIMVWHIDQDLCNRYFEEGSASTSTMLNGKRHDPAIVPLFRVGYDTNGRYIKDTAPSDPFYYYDENDLSKAVFDSGNFRSVTNGTQSLNSYPKSWEGKQNYNLHIEVLSAPGEAMTIKITSGTKDYTPNLSAICDEKTHNTLTIKGEISAWNEAEYTAAAIAISTSEDFSEAYMAKNAVLSEDGNSFSVTFEGLNPETQYYYKTYMQTTNGYVEATGITRTNSAPKEKTEISVTLFSDATSEKGYSIKAKYGSALKIPSGWLKSLNSKHAGYVIENWYYDAEFTKPYDMNAIIEKGTEDFSLYAKWVEE